MHHLKRQHSCVSSLQLLLRPQLTTISVRQTPGHSMQALNSIVIVKVPQAVTRTADAMVLTILEYESLKR